MTTQFYQVGGSLPANAKSYIRRDADKKLYNYLKEGKYCYILNARQVGKSSLRVHTSKRLEDEGFSCVNIDLNSIGSEDITAEEWYFSFIHHIIQELNFDEDKFIDWWDENVKLTIVNRFAKVFDKFILEDSSKNIIIMIDEIDSILGMKKDFSANDFFAVIRTFYNLRSEDERYNRVTFALFGVATPEDLMRDTSRTPFNIAHSVKIEQFKLEESFSLIEGLKNQKVDGKDILKKIFEWTSGTPYLTQKILDYITHHPIQELDNIDTVVDILFIKENFKEINISNIQNRIIENKKHNVKMFYLIGEIIHKGKVKADDKKIEQIYLKLSGLVKENNGDLLYTNKVYQVIFNQEWINENIGKVDRPLSQDLQRWIAMGKVDSALLQGKILELVNIWALERNDLSGIENEYLLQSNKIEQEGKLNEEKAKSQSKTIKLLLLSLVAAISLGIAVNFKLNSDNLELNSKKEKADLKARAVELQSEKDKLKLEFEKRQLELKLKNEKIKSIADYASKDIDIRLKRIISDASKQNEEYSHYRIPSKIDENLKLDKGILERFTLLNEDIIERDKGLVQLILYTKKTDFDKHLWLNTLLSMSLEQKKRLFQILHYRAYIDEAKVYIKEHSIEKGIELLNTTIENYPKKDETYYLLGDIYYQKKSYKQALEVYSKIRPKTKKVRLKVGIVYNDLGDYSKALEEFNKIDKQDDITYYNIGNSYYRMKDYATAIDSYKTAIEINPNNDKAHNDLGYIYLEKVKPREYKKAIESFKNATRANPKHYKAYNSIGLAYEKLDEKSLAIASYRQSIEANNEYNKPYIGIFKLQLIKKQPFDRSLEDKFIDIFQNQKEVFITYEMFVILQKISNGKQGNFLKKWRDDYKNTELLWRGFRELKSWAKREPNKVKRKRLLNVINTFRKHKSINKNID